MTSSCRTFWWLIVAAALLLAAVLASRCRGSTYYVVKHTAGDTAAHQPTSGGSRSDPMCINYFRDTKAVAGDIALCQPGHYGSYPWNAPFFQGEAGTNTGSAGNHIIYRSDPATCTPRSADWFTRETKLETPDPAKHVVFGNLTFGPYRSAPPSYTTAAPYYITLDGIWIDQGYLLFNIDVADVNVINCNVFAPLTNRDTTTYPTCLSYRWYSAGSDYHNTHIEDCYLYGGQSWMQVSGHMRGGNDVIHCRGWSNGSGLGYKPESTVEGDPMIFRYCNIDYQVMVGEYNDPGVLMHTVATVDPLYPRRKFTTATAPYPRVFVDVNDVDTGTLNYRYIETQNYAGTSFVLAEDTDFDIEVGDKVRFTDGIHGSGISLRAGNITLDGCTAWNMGVSRLLYVYNDVPGPFPNVHITNCLFYSSLNLYTIDLDTARLGNGFWFVNNTVVGNRWHTTYLDQLQSWAHYYTDLHYPQWYYGHAVDFGGYYAGTDTTTCRVCNNLIVGVVAGSSMGATVRNNNILYHNTNPSAFLSGTSDPCNCNNVTIYNGEPWGSEPHPFDGDGTYFVAANEDFNDVFTTTDYTHNLYADFMLKLSSPAIDAGDPNYDTGEDIQGWTRTGTPDVGAWEYGSTNPLAPTEATNPSPADGAVSVSATKDLSWTTGANSPTHHVFLGTVLQDVADGTGGTSKGIQAGTTYDTGTMSYLTTYYWRIEEGNEEGNVPGEVWDFQTRVTPTPKYGLIGKKGTVP